MPFANAKHLALQPESITSDEEAAVRLPPFPAAHATYTACRRLGRTPLEALQETLELWRELQAGARPAPRRFPIGW